MKASGNILKMKSILSDPVQYHLPIGDELIHMNKLIGQKISLRWSGVINDLHDGRVIKKSYGQGYSYKNFMKLASCDTCIIKPELCHFENGTCREPKWGEENCFMPHIIYLANSSGLKIGITRETQVPTRWIDQGASFALPILKVENRKISGLVEVEISKQINDKTNWRKMLAGNIENIDLYQARENVFEDFGDLLDDMRAEDIDSQVIEIKYPIDSVPEKISSLGLDKKPYIEGLLTGIKGQYLIFDNGVINIRKHQGYSIEIEWEL